MRYTRLTLLSLATSAVVVALSGCSSMSVQPNPQSSMAPNVESFGVEVNGVAPNRSLYTQFNEAMDPATIDSRTIVVKDSSGTAMPGNVTYDANFDVAGFQPSPALKKNANYTLTVTTGVASAQGMHLSADVTHSFTTRSSMDRSPIYVKSVTPAVNATCVSVTTPIIINLSEGAEVNTLTSSNITITGPGNMMIPAQIGYNVATAAVTLTPSSSLPTGNITVTVKNVADSAGVAMVSTYAWSFSTACGAGGSGGGSAATTQYEAPLINLPYTDRLVGQVTMDTSGSMTVQVTGESASTSYTVQFCPADASVNTSTDAHYPTPACFDVGAVSTDASGNGSSTVKFPKPGNWAGNFHVNNSAGKTVSETDFVHHVNNQVYMAILLPSSKTNGGVVAYHNHQRPLTSGAVSAANGLLKFSVKGASPNTAFYAAEAETRFIDGSGSYIVGAFTTDSSGNGTVSVVTKTDSSPSGDMFKVIAQDFQGAGYIGGFSVPQ